MLDVDPQTGEQVLMEQAPLKSRIIGFGYRVLQSEVVTVDGKKQYFILLGSQIILLPMNMDGAKAEVLSCKYSFNDMWYNHENNSILMASAQSGGSCVHIINLNDPNWKQDYIALNPPGKIAEVLKNTANVRKNLQHFKAPEWERKPRPVYLMSESIPKSVAGLVDSIKTYWQSPVFLNGTGTNRAENWDRSSLQNEVYRNRCDARRKYDATSIEIVNSFVPRYEYSLGIAFCSGHGDDPYMFHVSTLKRILDASNGKKTGLIFPELEDHSYNFAFVMDDNFYPLADNCKDKNTWIYIRTMHTFWQANAYLPMWSKLLSGEYSNVFVPAMEDTSDKSMELSLAARPGIWTSGATDSRGARCARDNSSFDRMRQHSNQMLPNHFLRMMIYHISCGAQYIYNFSVDQKYMGLLLELIGKGALFVPESKDIVSFSPVHLSM